VQSLVVYYLVLSETLFMIFDLFHTVLSNTVLSNPVIPDKLYGFNHSYILVSFASKKKKKADRISVTE